MYHAVLINYTVHLVIAVKVKSTLCKFSYTYCLNDQFYICYNTELTDHRCLKGSGWWLNKME